MGIIFVDSYCIDEVHNKLSHTFKLLFSNTGRAVHNEKDVSWFLGAGLTYGEIKVINSYTFCNIKSTSSLRFVFVYYMF